MGLVVLNGSFGLVHSVAIGLYELEVYTFVVEKITDLGVVAGCINTVLGELWSTVVGIDVVVKFVVCVVLDSARNTHHWDRMDVVADNYYHIVSLSFVTYY